MSDKMSTNISNSSYIGINLIENQYNNEHVQDRGKRIIIKHSFNNMHVLILKVQP